MDSPQELPKGAQPCQHSDFGPVKLISGFWPTNFIVLIICYGSHGKLMQISLVVLIKRDF